MLFDRCIVEILAGVSFNWTEIVKRFSIYTTKLDIRSMNSADIKWSIIPQFPACQILDVMEHFSIDKDDQILQIFISLNKIDNFGINIFLEEKNKVVSRFLKTGMLSYDGPSFSFNDLFLPQKKRGIVRFHQSIYSEEDANVHCKNYPFNGSSSFGECDRKYFHHEFQNHYKLMPFWAAANLSEVTVQR